MERRHHRRGAALVRRRGALQRGRPARQDPGPAAQPALQTRPRPPAVRRVAVASSGPFGDHPLVLRRAQASIGVHQSSASLPSGGLLGTPVLAQSASPETAGREPGWRRVVTAWKRIPAPLTRGYAVLGAVRRRLARLIPVVLPDHLAGIARLHPGAFSVCARRRRRTRPTNRGDPGRLVRVSL